MVRVEFRYKDLWSRGGWNYQVCIVPSVAECERIYGLGTEDCRQYEILDVKELENGKVYK